MHTLITFGLAAVVLLPQTLDPGPIHEAARAGDLAAIRALVARDARLVDATDARGRTPLHAAVIDRHADAVGCLVELGADVNRRDGLQMTPLVVAAELGAEDAVTALLAAGADVDAAGPIGTPLHRAAFHGRTTLVRLLLDAGADPEAVVRDRTALHLAATTGQVDAAALLVARGANVDARDGRGRTPLVTALGAGHDRVSEMAEVFLAAGASVNVADESGVTPLAAAVSYGHAAVVSRLLAGGAEAGVGDPVSGRTLLHVAAIRGYGDIAGALLARGLDPVARDRAGRTPLDYAREHGNLTVAAMLDSDASVGEPPADGTTSEAVENGAAVVRYLRTRGWVLETARHVLVFDNEASGRAPDHPRLANGHVAVGELAHEHVLALYTCYHAQPGTMEFIHGMEDELGDVTYVHREADQWRGGRNTIYLSGQQTVSVGEVAIHAAEVDDSAFTLDYLVEADGLTVFYAGFYPDDLQAFRKEIDYLAGDGRRADIAFVHAVEDEQLPYLDHLMARLRPKAVFVMSPDRRPEELEAAARLVAERYPDVAISYPRDPGDRFYVRDGRIQ